LVPKDEYLIGKLVQVEITETGKHFMKCSLLKNVIRPDVPLPLKQGQVSGVIQVSLV
jgi:threonylcarbamoyladenosine tRNA methylthiotransferase CDKAL1